MISEKVWRSASSIFVAMVLLVAFAGQASASGGEDSELADRAVVEAVLFQTGPVADSLSIDKFGVDDPAEQLSMRRFADSVLDELDRLDGSLLAEVAADFRSGDPYLFQASLQEMSGKISGLDEDVIAGGRLDHLGGDAAYGCFALVILVVYAVAFAATGPAEAVVWWLDSGDAKTTSLHSEILVAELTTALKHEGRA